MLRHFHAFWLATQKISTNQNAWKWRRLKYILPNLYRVGPRTGSAETSGSRRAIWFKPEDEEWLRSVYSNWLFIQRTLTYFVRGNITVNWPPVWLVRTWPNSKSVYSFNSTKQQNPNQSNRRSAVKWYFPLRSKWVFSGLYFFSFFPKQQLQLFNNQYTNT